MSAIQKLATLQLAIMQVLWERGEATVAAVREALAADRDLAHTTIATMLVKMERKGIVEHRLEGRAFIYTPRIQPEQVKSSMVSDLMERLFAGNVTEMMSHLLDENEVSRDELTRLKAMISRKEQQQQELDQERRDV